MNLPPWACHGVRSAAAASPHSVQRCTLFGLRAQSLPVWRAITGLCACLWCLGGIAAEGEHVDAHLP